MGRIDPDIRDLGRLFDAYGDAMVLYARQWLGGPVAEDVVQDVFVRLMSTRKTPVSPRAWLFRSVRNAALNELRATRRRTGRHQAVAMHSPQWFDAGLDDKMDAAVAQGILETLPDEQREVVILRIWASMTLKEIAATVSRATSTVYDQYRSAIAEIRERMGESCRTEI